MEVKSEKMEFTEFFIALAKEKVIFLKTRKEFKTPFLKLRKK